MVIVGYGVCGPNEKYLEMTLKEFERLCDHVVICGNNIDQKSAELIEVYGFELIHDNREWGIDQPNIKENLVKRASKYNPDWFIALDMDERFDRHFTRETLEELSKKGHSSFITQIINLWDDGYAPERSFVDKVQIWKNTGDYSFEKKNLHCGLVPRQSAISAAFAPHLVIHYGLKDAEDRERKVKRYEKYDPNAQFMGNEYYESLSKNLRVLPFDEDKLQEEVAKEVETFYQPIRKPKMTTVKKYFHVRTPGGTVVDIPEYQLDETLKRDGFELISKDPIVVSGSNVMHTEVIKPATEEDTVCEECGFKAESAFGLRSHKRKHEKTDGNASISNES